MKRPLLIVLILASFAATALFVARIYFALREPPKAPRVNTTIPEGYTVLQVNEILRASGVLVGEELSRELEGYIFPDTYEFFIPSGAGVVEAKFLENFREKAEPLLTGASEEEARNILIMASLIEREVPDPDERRVVSGILWKRIEAGIPLQADATICYSKSGPCLPITEEDKSRDSLYNTYRYLGLPPGPISNPGADAIEASANPEESPYWYYISDPETGRTIFAQTLDEHNRNVVKYLND